MIARSSHFYNKICSLGLPEKAANIGLGCKQYSVFFLFISVRQSITKLKIAFTEKLINERFYLSTHNQMSERDQGSSSLGYLLSSMPYRDIESS